jgi:uncharacterized protein YabE (DUF348 family)
MKKFVTAYGLLCVMVVAGLAAAALPNYAGTWVLDKDKSTGLSPNMTASFEMVVTQDAQKITVKGMFGEIAYNLDGSKSKVQMTGRMPGEATAYLEKKDDGKIVLHTEREISFQDNTFNIKTAETWELADGGKTLKVSRTSEGGPRGKQSSELVFTMKS